MDGVTYTARSRSGAPFALARSLVEAGVPNQPMTVIAHGLRGESRYRSIHEMAGWTIAESAAKPVHRVPWQPYEGEADAEVPRSSPASGQKPPSSRPGGTTAHRDEQGQKNPVIADAVAG